MFLPDLKLMLHHYPEVNKTASTNAQGFDPTTGKMHFRFQLLQHRGRIPSNSWRFFPLESSDHERIMKTQRF